MNAATTSVTTMTNASNSIVIRPPAGLQIRTDFTHRIIALPA